MQIDSFSFLPVLYYCKERIQNRERIEPITLFRLIRFFYNLRKDTTVFKTASMQTINALKLINKLNEKNDIVDILNVKGISSTILNKEEIIKLKLFKDNDNRFKYEDLFWRAEDNKQNEGSIIHLIEVTESSSKDNQQFNINDFEEKIELKDEIIDILEKEIKKIDQNNKILKQIKLK